MAVSLSALIVAAQLFGRSDASLSFKPNCTLPPPGTNYVAGPNVRSTTTILWNLLSIIILCTWNILHLNVPGIRRAKKLKRWQLWRKLWRAILDSRVKAKWMLLTIFIPEYLLAMALGDWVAARSGRSQWKRFNNGDWEMIHGYMANMGYFVLDWGEIDSGEGSKTEGVAEGDNKDVDNKAASHGTTGAQVTPAGIPVTRAIAKPKEPYHKHLSEEVSEILDSSAILSDQTRTNLQRLRSRYWALNAWQWAGIFNWGICNPPDTTATQLEKLDKGGTLVKALALVQVAYLVVQLIARKIGGLPSTQLEITALAFSASACVTYCLYWNRPQGVETIHIMKAKKKFEGSPDKLLKLAWDGSGCDWDEPEKPSLASRKKAEFDPDYGPAPIPNDGSHSPDVDSSHSPDGLPFDNSLVVTLVLGSVFGGTLFGGLHCLAWDFQFPTPGEALGWRICSVITTCLPILLTLPTYVWAITTNCSPSEKMSSNTAWNTYIVVHLGLFLVPYVLARLFLLVEMFRSLFFLPPEAFVDTWSGSFPHWG